MKIYKVDKILLRYISGVNNPNTLELTDGENVIYNGIDVSISLDRYSEYFCKYTFDADYQSFKRVVWSSYLKAYKALQLEYNPLYNYDITEKYAHTENDGSVTQTNTPEITSTITTPHTSTTSQYYTTNENSDSRLNEYTTTEIGNGENVSTNITNGTNTVVTTHENVNIEFPIDDVTTHSGDKVTTDIIRKYGNYSKLYAPQKMLEDEISLRRKIILDMFIDDFADRYFFIGGDISDIEIVYE